MNTFHGFIFDGEDNYGNICANNILNIQHNQIFSAPISHYIKYRVQYIEFSFEKKELKFLKSSGNISYAMQCNMHSDDEKEEDKKNIHF